MRALLWILVIILSLAVVTAAESPFEYESLTIEQSIDNSVEIIPTRSDYFIDFFDLTLYLFPTDSYRQKVNNEVFNIDPTDQTFRWLSPLEKRLILDTDFTIEASNAPVEIKEKVNFPLDTIPLNVKDYLETTDSIDVNDDIRALAQSLAQGEDDLFVLEHKLARWVNSNIEYNLSTITAEANHPASWVLDTGYGVCDELTNLFIALNRALGIPARFVSGIAYSDSILFDTKWGNHGWAEVYFPGYGWVPYDVTYQEYGAIDATHLEFEKGVDGSSPSVEYRTKGLYYNFEPTQLQFDTIITEYGPLRTPRTDLEVSAQENSVAFGSYNVIKATITNLHDYYVAEDVTLAQALELEYFNPLRQSVVLKPGETKEVTWRVKVDPNLETGYIYTFPVNIFGASGGEAQTAFAVLERAEYFDSSYMQQFEVIPESSDAITVQLDCIYGSEHLVGAKTSISCTSEQVLESICLAETCFTQTTTATFNLPTETVGVNTAIIDVTTSEGESQSFYSYKVIDQAELRIANITISEQIRFNEFATLQVHLIKESSANPSNVTMTLTHDMLEKEWFFSFLDKDRKFDIEVPGQGYITGVNEFTIELSYLDSSGNIHTVSQSATSELVELSTTEVAIVRYNTFASKVIKFLANFGIGRYYAEIIAPALIMIGVFLLVGITKRIIFRKIRKEKRPIPPQN